MFHVEQNKTKKMDTGEKKTTNWKDLLSLTCTCIIFVCSAAMLVQYYKFDFEMSGLTVAIWWILVVYSIYRTIAMIVSRRKK